MIPESAEQRDDREEHAREPDGEVEVAAGSPNGCMSSGATRMKSAVSPPSPSSISQKRLDATRQARLRSPFSSSSLKTGTNADESAASATSARTRFGIWNATVNALILPRRRRSSRPRPSRGRGRARARGRWRARRSSVERASRRRWPRPGGRGPSRRPEPRSPARRSSRRRPPAPTLRGRAAEALSATIARAR